MHEGGSLPCPVVTTTGRDVVGVAQHGSQQQQKLYDGFPKHIAVYGSLKGVTERNAACGWAVRMDQDQEEESCTPCTA